MKNKETRRLEIFLRLALRRLENTAQKADSEKEILLLDDSPIEEEKKSFSIEDFPVFGEQLDKKELAGIESLLKKYNTAEDGEIKQIEDFIGKDDETLDESVHWSHISEALKKESFIVQNIVGDFLSPANKNHFEDFIKSERKTSEFAASKIRYKPEAVKKSVHKGFIKHFVCLDALDDVTPFDRLDGAQTVRLIRLAGISEVAYACVRIEAVESVAAFLKRFSTEDARAIATQLSSLPKTSPERLTFAENLVQQMMELEQSPTALLDMLGLQLIGIHLCQGPENRVRYTKQKMPAEFSPELDELINRRCRKTPEPIQKQVSREINELSDAVLKKEKENRKNK